MPNSPARSATWRRLRTGEPDGIRVKRICDPVAPEDGERFLVNRLWPLDAKRTTAHVSGWLKDVAPSGALHRLSPNRVSAGELALSHVNYPGIDERESSPATATSGAGLPASGALSTLRNPHKNRTGWP